MSVAGNLARPLARNLARGIAESPGGVDVDNLLVDDNLDAYLIDDTNTDQHLITSATGFSAEAGFSISGEIAHGNSVIITGSGFGTKAQAAPAVWDMGQEVFIDGVENTAHAALNDGDNAVGPMYDDGTNAAMSLTRTHRHTRVDRHYASASIHGNSFIHAGGLAPFPGGNTARQSFSAFKIKFPSLDPTFVDAANFSNLSGTFIEGVDGELGEAITITFDSSDFAANILTIGVGPLGYTATQLGIYSPNLNITSSTTPFTIVGDVSGATADCETSSPHNQTASGKLWRIDQESQEGVECITQISNQSFWVESNTGGVDEIVMNRGTHSITYNTVTDFTSWIHVEVRFDFRVGTLIAATHRAAGNLSSVTKVIPGQDGSNNILDQWLNIHSFGYDATEHPYHVDYGEVYIDSTPQRVVIGNNAIYANCTKLELQRPTSWIDGEIIITMNNGEFNDVAGNFLYVLSIEDVATLIGQFT